MRLLLRRRFSWCSVCADTVTAACEPCALSVSLVHFAETGQKHQGYGPTGPQLGNGTALGATGTRRSTGHV
jgi:hypothetical protein